MLDRTMLQLENTHSDLLFVKQESSKSSLTQTLTTQETQLTINSLQSVVQNMKDADKLKDS
jgi:hypothetical protein